MTDTLSKPDREAWIIKLQVSVDPGKTTRYGDGSGFIEVYTSFNRIIHPARFEKKILKNIGYDSTLDNIIQAELNTGNRTMTGIIIADHITKRIYLCRSTLFLSFDDQARVQLRNNFSATRPWWFELPVNSLPYLAQALSDNSLLIYTLLEVGFVVEQKSNFGFKQEPVLSVEKSTAADALMALLSGKQLQKSPSAATERKAPLAPLTENQNTHCSQCGTRMLNPDTKFCTNCGARVDPVSKKTSKQYIEEGHDFIGHRLFTEAVGSYDKALALEPNDAAVWEFRGEALDSLGRYEEALASYDKAISIIPFLNVLWDDRAKILLNLGWFAEAVESSDKAISLKANYAPAWFHRGEAFGSLGQFAEALASFDKALAIDPKDAHVWCIRGVALTALGRYAEAIESYDKALAINPDFAEAKQYREIAQKK